MHQCMQLTAQDACIDNATILSVLQKAFVGEVPSVLKGRLSVSSALLC